MSVEKIPVPDLGGAEAVEVIEVLVSVGDQINAEDSLVTLESDKASMEAPSPAAGKVIAIKVNVGDQVSEGDELIELEVDESVKENNASAKSTEQQEEKSAQMSQQPKPVSPVATPAPTIPQVATQPVNQVGGSVYAGPAVRKLARELGVNLTKIQPTGPRGRLQKEDLHNYVREQLEKASQGSIPTVPAVDYSKFGDFELEPMSKIARVTAENMHRSWLNVPHVTQFDEVDLSELDAVRKKFKGEAEKTQLKLTPLAFLLKAASKALLEHQNFNSSLHHDGKHFVRKKYIHIGMAVDTPKGLVVPVIRDVDQKDIWQLAEAVIDLSVRAREGKLKPAEMQGGCFTISSLGAIGGTGFTPVVNTPEVAILGVSKSQVKPVWNGNEFEPVNMLPLSLSYDHRAINGADAGRFMTTLVEVIQGASQLIN